MKPSQYDPEEEAKRIVEEDTAYYLSIISGQFNPHSPSNRELATHISEIQDPLKQLLDKTEVTEINQPPQTPKRAA